MRMLKYLAAIMLVASMATADGWSIHDARGQSECVADQPAGVEYLAVFRIFGDSQAITKQLNAYAAEGWRLVSATAAGTPGSNSFLYFERVKKSHCIDVLQ